MSAVTQTPSSIDPVEVAKFSALASEWWNPHGKFGVLHRFNPVRLAYIRERALDHFKRDPRAKAPFSGLRLLDIGCGGGLLSEPMTRLGFSVLGADASEKNIEAARAHAREHKLEIDYRAEPAEALVSQGELFDVILNMEVVEHVADLGQFLKSCAALLKPDGLMVVATLNRTAKSFALAIVGAEYILGWLPKGTHNWDKFIKPVELDVALTRAGFEGQGETGVAYNPLTGEWHRTTDTDVNYMLTAVKF